MWGDTQVAELHAKSDSHCVLKGSLPQLGKQRRFKKLFNLMMEEGKLTFGDGKEQGEKNNQRGKVHRKVVFHVTW